MSAYLSDLLGLVVKVLCDVRLVCLTLLSLQIAPDPQLLLLVLGTPLSLYLLLRWNQHGVKLLESWWWPVIDMAFIWLLLIAPRHGLDAVYIGVTLAIYAVGGNLRTVGIGIASLGAITGFLFWAELPRYFAQDWREPLSIPIMMIACAGIGMYMRLVLNVLGSTSTSQNRNAIQTVAEEERARLARDIHDTVAKSTTGCYALATSMHNRMLSLGNPEADRIAELRNVLKQSQQEARTILISLRAPSIEEEGDLLKNCLDRWQSAYFDIDFKLQGDTQLSLPRDSRVELRRVLDEIAENVHRHAQASEVVVAVRTGADAIEIVVTDNGIGMDTADIARFARNGHYGLLGMQERMARIKGTFALESVAGTKITLTIPTRVEKVENIEQTPSFMAIFRSKLKFPKRKVKK